MAWPPYLTTTTAPRNRRMYGNASTRARARRSGSKPGASSGGWSGCVVFKLMSCIPR